MSTRIDWRELLDKNRIEYIERGANVKRGELNIRCPFCGSADPSMHMGINLETGFYACWRNRQGHSGKSPLRLLMKLLGVGYAAARELAGFGESYVDPEGFTALAARILGRVPQENELRALDRQRLMLPEREYLPIRSVNARLRRWCNYLIDRHFDERDVDDLARKYDLRACVAGDDSQRLVLPYMLEGELVSWTARALGGAAIRYKDLALEDSVVPPKKTLYLFDEAAKGGQCLVVVEGPIDALKLDYYGAAHGLHAVALSTNSIKPEQLYMLEELAPRYDEVLVMMDSKTEYGFVDSMRMKAELSVSVPTRIVETPFGRSDAGDLRPNEVDSWAQDMTANSKVN